MALPTPQKEPSPQLLLLSMTLYGMEYPCWSVCASCAGCAPSQLFAHWRGRAGKREGLDTVQALLSNCQNTGVLSALLQSQTQNVAPYGLL